MPKKTPAPFAVGDKLKVRLNDGRIVDAIIRAVIPSTNKLQVDYANEQTALIHERQVIRK